MYSLTYTLDGAPHVVGYSWDKTGLYTFEFQDPDGTATTETDHCSGHRPTSRSSARFQGPLPKSLRPPRDGCVPLVLLYPLRC